MPYLRLKLKNVGWLMSGIAVLLFLLLMSSFIIRQILNNKSKIISGVSIGQLNLNGKTIQQAKTLLQAKIDKLTNKGIAFVYNNKKVTALPVVGVNGNWTQLWAYNVEQTVQQAYILDHQQLIWRRCLNNFGLGSGNIKLEPKVNLNEQKIIEFLKDNFNQYEVPSQNAALFWQKGQIRIKPAHSGMSFDYKKVLQQFKDKLFLIEPGEIELNLQTRYPQIFRKQIKVLVPLYKQVSDWAPISFQLVLPDYYQGYKKFKIKKWVLNKKEWSNWLTVKLDSSSRPRLGIDRKVAFNYLQKLAEKINTPAKNAKFTIKNGRVIEWQSSFNGFKLDIVQTINQLENKLNKNILETNKLVKLVLREEKSQITNSSVNNLGIKELFGRGESNFRGSPINRIHNIRTGATALNGLLIKPKEKFSLLKALGEINAKTGYLPELVIKEGRTIPEYGGGLCQIGTTLFRLAINSGLPIVERRNHSYRVSYYEPAGTDATIYNPWPDLKFMNDSQNYLLLQTYIKGTKLIFEFWGTKDGRQVSTTTPVVYNIVKPPQAEYIKSNELKPGEKKLVEHAHNGADAYFKRIIIWPNKKGVKPIEEIFRSHYVPWREKWLVGETEKTASSSNLIIEK